MHQPASSVWPVLTPSMPRPVPSRWLVAASSRPCSRASVRRTIVRTVALRIIRAASTTVSRAVECWPVGIEPGRVHVPGAAHAQVARAGVHALDEARARRARRHRQRLGRVAGAGDQQQREQLPPRQRLPRLQAGDRLAARGLDGRHGDRLVEAAVIQHDGRRHQLRDAGDRHLGVQSPAGEDVAGRGVVHRERAGGDVGQRTGRIGGVGERGGDHGRAGGLGGAGVAHRALDGRCDEHRRQHADAERQHGQPDPAPAPGAGAIRRHVHGYSVRSWSGRLTRATTGRVAAATAAVAPNARASSRPARPHGTTMSPAP